MFIFYYYFFKFLFSFFGGAETGSNGKRMAWCYASLQDGGTAKSLSRKGAPTCQSQLGQAL